MADAEIFRRIDEILEGYVLEGEAKPYFAKVYRGNPEGLMPMNRLCAYWNLQVVDPPEGKMTLTTWMRQHVVRVKCFWLPTPLEETRENRELEIFSVSHELPEAFWGDVGLNATVTDCIPTDIQIETEQFPLGSDSPMFRTVTFDLQLKILEGGTISR